ncbi:ATP-grasp domain-containing protein [Sandarakinorhabdus sp.]|uniref:ATP-grasp domain-containing protein n=1 Tax=Sandarakinorhabdus sp. TaxID=1916663 RepID=UPI003F71E774
MHIWFNAGYSQTCDAILLIKAAAGAAPISVNIHASHARRDAPALAVADTMAIEPSHNRSTADGAAAYVDWCLQHVQQHRIDLFIVQRGRGAIAARRAEFEAIGCTPVLAADAKTLATIENKREFYDACTAAGLPTPVSIPVHDLAEFDTALGHLAALGHAACIKPPQGVFGTGYFQLDDATPLFRQLMQIDDRAIQTSVMRGAIAEMGRIPEMLVMQHLPGTEWSVDCLCDRGRIITGFVRAKRQHSQFIDANPLIMREAARIAALFNLSNLVNIQFKSAVHDADAPHILEINPRMSGGCGYGALAGINLPFLQILFAAGLLDEAQIPPLRPTLTSSIAQAIDLTGLAIEERAHDA